MRKWAVHVLWLRLECCPLYRGTMPGDGGGQRGPSRSLPVWPPGPPGGGLVLCPWDGLEWLGRHIVSQEREQGCGNTAWSEALRPWGWAEPVPHSEAVINFQLSGGWAGSCKLQTPAQ